MVTRMTSFRFLVKRRKIFEKVPTVALVYFSQIWEKNFLKLKLSTEFYNQIREKLRLTNYSNEWF